MTSPTEVPEEDRNPPSPCPGREPGNSESGSRIARILGDPPAETTDPRVPVVWGRYRGTKEVPAGAFLVVCGPSPPDSEPNSDRDGPVDRLRVAIPGDEELPPLEDPKRFEQSLIDRSLADAPTPEATRKSHRDAIVQFLSGEPRYTLQEILRDAHQEEFQTWVRTLLESLVGTEPPEYCVYARFQSFSTGPDTASEDVDPSEDSPDSEPDPLEVQAVTKPSEGRPVRDLREGDEILARIVGSNVNQLPETLVDRDRSQPASVPLACQVRSRDSVETLPDQYGESDPSDYERVTVELKPGVTGQTLLFRDDRLKRVEDSDESDSSGRSLPGRELAVLGMLLALLLAVVLVLFSL